VGNLYYEKLINYSPSLASVTAFITTAAVSPSVGGETLAFAKANA